jgi:outer membrane cobalamin receptor
LRAVTDSSGVFRFALPAAGAFRVAVRHVAYTAFDSDPVDVTHGETVSLEIRLAVARIALEPLVVTVRTSDRRLAGFHERRLVHRFGRFLSREDIERRSAPRTTDLLRGFPGIAIVPVQSRGRAGPARNLVTMRGTTGSCEPAIYIDGIRSSQSEQSTLDDVLTPESLEGVEVYASATTAPPQYAGQAPCGVVLFWTRTTQGGSKPWGWKQLMVGAGAIVTLLLLAR